MSCTSSMRSGPGTGTVRNRSPGECPDVEVREDMEEKILLVEDEEKLARMVELELRYEGYQVDKSFDGRSGLERALSGEYDLVLLDIMLPQLSGMEVLRRLRKEGVLLPVIMINALDSVVEKLSGLDSGADDYVTKPFSMRILLKKVYVILSRKSQEANIYDDGFLKVDFELGIVQQGVNECLLSPTVYLILKKLIENKVKLLTYSVLLDSLWD